MRPSRRLALLAALATTVATGVVLGTPAQAATVFGAGTPQFLASMAPGTLHPPFTPALNFTSPDLAGEPSVGVNWNTGTGLYMAGSNVLKLGFDPAKPGVTWSDASPFYGSVTNLDPILVTQPKTGITIAGGDTGACAVMFRSTDDGTTWTPTVPCPVVADHPTVGWSPSSADPTKSVFYFCQQQDLDNCATSTDDGVTWLPGVPLSQDCLGLHGHLKGGPDGTAYLPSATCFPPTGNDSFVGGLKTTDDGATWTGYTIPGALTPDDGFDPAVTVTPDNTLYEAWNADKTHHPVIASSKDDGTTWSTPVDLAGTVTPPLVAATFPTLQSGDNGRLAYSFLGTSAGDPSVDPFAAGFHGVWYVYTSFSYDGGATWTTVRVTPTPVQYGEIDAGGTTTQGQRNLLDFIDSSLTKDGRVVVAYADGCLADCEAAGTSGKTTAQADAEALSTHAWASVGYQTAGQGLFAAYDVQQAPAATTLTATGGLDGVALSWPAPNDGGTPISGYQVLRGTTPGAETAYATTTATSYRDTGITPGTTYYYRVTATNAVGTGPASNEAAATPYTLASAPTLTAATGKDPGTAQLSWTTPYDGGKPITGYNVYRGTSSGGEVLVQTITQGTSYVDSGLQARTTYWYQVAAVTSAGVGARSNEVSATPKK